MVIILYDTPQSRKLFYPFSLTRPLADIRYGILTNRERWEKITNTKVYTLSEDYLSEDIPEAELYLYVDAQTMPTEEQINQLLGLGMHEICCNDDFSNIIAFKEKKLYASAQSIALGNNNRYRISKSVKFLPHSWYLFQSNEQAIRTDLKILAKGRISETIHPSNIVFGKQNIFIEEGASIRGCTINAEDGLVYIGRNALVMEGTNIRGTVAICNSATVKMGTKIYTGTTIGPYCVAGGEIKNSIMMAYSNKAHEGYLGDSVIGEWCNLGAGTSNSNLKNTAGEVKMWSEVDGDFVKVGKKAGLMMGDYSRSAINTSFNTGTVVGICCNVFDRNFLPKHISSFSWGIERYDLDRALADIERWKEMKGKILDEKEKELIKYLFNMIK